MTDVVFAYMPFARTEVPSLALATFLSLLRQRGYSCELLHHNIRLSALLGRDRYDRIAHQLGGSRMMLAEVLFAQVLNKVDHSSYVEAQARQLAGDSCASALAGLKSILESFIRDAASEILSLGPRVVGFSSIFQQQMAILSCAQELRYQGFDGVILLGGSNCEGPMGRQAARSFDFIDFVVSGPGELVLPGLLDSLLRDAPRVPLPGVFPTARRQEWPRHPRAVADEGPLDHLPYPDFTPYFNTCARFGHPNSDEVQLPFEGSRGCWWGAKHHCTFCGLNGENMEMRSKSPERALAEVRHLANRWPRAMLISVDNIMPLSFWQDFLPALAEDPVGPIFYEVKSNLRFQQLELLRRAGVVELQPGIESLSDATLLRMHKGVSALQNIQLLRDSKRLGLNLRWNLLFGFPGEKEHEYTEQLDIIPLLVHLQPPVGAGQVELDRFSPMFERPEEFGIQRVRPTDGYHLMYPSLQESELLAVAYYFEGSYPERNAFAVQRRHLQKAVTRWHGEHACSFLALEKRGACTCLVDTRPDACHRVTSLSTAEEAALSHAQIPIRVERLLDELGPDFGVDESRRALEQLLGLGALLKVGGRVLSIVVESVPPEELEAALAFRRLQYGSCPSSTSSRWK